MRTCWALESGDHGNLLLVFRGGHQLRVGKDSTSPGAPSAGLVWVRFEPALPPVEGGGRPIRKFADLLCCVWLGVLANEHAQRGVQGRRQGALAVVPGSRVPVLVRRLDVALLDVAEMTQQVARSQGLAPHGAKRQLPT